MPNVTPVGAGMDPRTWPRHEVDDATRAMLEFRDPSARSAAGRTGIVVGSTGPLGQVAGRKALEAGGSSVDAMIATALTQIALAGGAWVSYAGFASIVHYDASSKQALSLNAGFRSFRGETEGLSIPRPPTPSGRSAFVPGFFKGMEVAHRRFGKLPWASLFEPAIFVCENGTELGEVHAGMFKMREPVLLRTPEPREAFGLNGSVPGAGDTIYQFALAQTLRNVAEQGADYIYRGPWAKRFVEIVNREGGKAAREDLADYHVDWSEPLHTTFNGHDLYALGGADYGGAALLEGLNLCEAGGLGDPSSDPEAMYWLIQIARQAHSNGTARTLSAMTPAARVSKDNAARLWELMRASGGFVGLGALADAFTEPSHSDFVCTVDGDGNVTAVTHTINTSIWGTTGIFVDGISIPDAAAIQPENVAAQPPGSHIPAPTNPMIALRDNKPVLASSSIGSGLTETTLQCVLAVLGRGETVADVVGRPLFHYPALLLGDSVTSEIKSVEDRVEAARQRDGAGARIQERIAALIAEGVPPLDVFAELMRRTPQTIEDRFDAGLLEQVRALGVDLLVLASDDANIPRGYWAGVSIDHESGRIEGGRTPFSNGLVEAL